jgi:hypothetical protein
MRISAEERRQLNRRLRHRLPQAFRRKLKQLPELVLIVAATFVVSPKAWAQVQAGKLKPTLVTITPKNAAKTPTVGSARIEATKVATPPKTFTKNYTKEELNQKVPKNPVISMQDRIMDELTGLLDRMAKNQSGSSQTSAREKLLTKEPTKDEYLLSLAAMKEEPTSRNPSGDSLRLFLGGEVQKAGSERVKKKINLLDSFNSGMTFDLKIDEIFAEKPKEHERGEVRYGLILEDITPDRDAPKRAAVTEMGNELQFAGHADVKWTIGPVREKPGRKLFKVENVARSEANKDKADGKPSLWSRLRVPKAAISGSITPKNFDNLTKVSQENMPQWEVQAGQVEGYYNLTYVTKTNGERLSETHEVKVPLIGETAIGRRFDDHFQVIQTSAYNILVDKRLPLLSVHYLNVEDRYKGDLTFAFGKNKRKKISISGTGKAKNAATDKEKGTETYDLSYGEEF